MSERIIATLHAILSDGSEVTQGQSVDLAHEDEARLEEQRALVPVGFDSFEEYSEFKLDSYRAGRGDAGAAAKLAQAAQQGRFDAHQAALTADAAQGGVEDLTQPGTNSYIAILREQTPTVDETVALAEGNPEKAQEVLDAEKVVTGNDSRVGVTDGLTKIIEG